MQCLFAWARSTVSSGRFPSSTTVRPRAKCCPGAFYRYPAPASSVAGIPSPLMHPPAEPHHTQPRQRNCTLHSYDVYKEELRGEIRTKSTCKRGQNRIGSQEIRVAGSVNPTVGSYPSPIDSCYPLEGAPVPE